MLNKSGEGSVYEPSQDSIHGGGSTQLVAWDSAAIGDLAKKQGRKEVYFADLETLSILRVWSQYTVHVYGK